MIRRVRLDDYRGSFGCSGAYAAQAWQAAYEATRGSILASYSPDMQAAVAYIRAILPKSGRDDWRCERCGGEGFRDDEERWIILSPHLDRPAGKRCFRCTGSGIEPSADPVFFRRHICDHLVSKLNSRNLAALQLWAQKVIASNETQQPYRRILMDLAEAISKSDWDYLKTAIR